MKTFLLINRKKGITLERTTIHSLSSFSGEFIIYFKKQYHFLKTLRAREIRIICKYFGFKNGYFALNALEKYYKTIDMNNYYGYLFLSHIDCKKNETNLNKCTLHGNR